MTTEKQEFRPARITVSLEDINHLCGIEELRTELLASMSREAAALADYAELKIGYDQMVENLAHEMDLKVAALALVEGLKGDKEHLLNVIAELRERINKNDPNRTL